MKKVLILGKGYIGSNLERTLSAAGHDTMILSKAVLDYTRYDLIKDYIVDNKPNVVVNCSGYTGFPNIDAAEDDRNTCWDLNTSAPFMIAMACHNSGTQIAQMIHISSGCIYNGYEKEFTEEDEPNFGLFNTHSSYYCKTKHAADIALSNYPCHMLRIRMPFCGTSSPRNLFSKLLRYDNLISMDNSMTCMYDLCNFIEEYINRIDSMSWGPYNVANKGSVNAKRIIEILSEYGLSNPNHKFIELKDLKTKALRSNCVLSTKMIEDLGMGLPPVEESIRRCANLMVANKV